MTEIHSIAAASVIRTFERLGLRGGPTLLRMLWGAGFGRRYVSAIHLPSGSKIRFPTFDHYWARYLWGGVVYEPDVQWILDCLSSIPNKLFVDCGANIGYWTVRMSEKHYGFSDFVAIEANATMVEFTRQNLSLNSIRGTVVHAAISDRSGETLRLGKTYHHATASIDVEGVPVQSVTLADLLKDQELRNRLTVVKLDVEGSEVPALRGAPAHCEWNPVYIYEDWRSSGMKVTEFLIRNHFCVIAVSPGKQPRQMRSVSDAIDFSKSTVLGNCPSNLVACRQDLFDVLMAAFNRC